MLITKRNHLLLAFALLLLTVMFSAHAHAEVRVPSLIGDNMVLQQETRVRIWGTADPKEQITVTFQKELAKTSADDRGHWQILIGPFKAGGPYELSISASNTLSFKNILVGEVWVCSGQSNMEWPLINTNGGTEAVAQANFPEIRLFTVLKATSNSPLEDVQGRWVVTTPDQAGQFSAVAYYFGRELNQKLKLPVGLIHTSWGGTPAEAWTSSEALAGSAELQPILERYKSGLQDLPQRQEQFKRRLEDWIKQNLYEDPGNKGESLGYANPETNVSDWPSMSLPQYFETVGLTMDGAIWFRKEVDIPQSWNGQSLELSLAAIDDFDTTYFNGTRVGSVGVDTPDSYVVQRRYKIPGELVKAGKNVIAVRVFDSAGEGGFGPGKMALGPVGSMNGDAIALVGSWNYKVEVQFEPKNPDWGSRPQIPGPTNQNSPGVLYNAMLAPLTPYAIRGAIWYQGESNATRAYQYRTLFPTMIRNWRAAWANQFPFYFVQLANFQPIKTEPGDSEWAELREAQALTLREPATGMAVIIDIGQANDIHPRNKVDVGHRLALWALADTYKQKLEFSGPLFSSFRVDGNKIRVKFKHATGLKSVDGGPIKGFAIAGEDHKFVWAEATIDGANVIVWSKDVTKPVAVRYAWADNPISNLYNGSNLPASPFRTDEWPGVTVNRK